MCFHSHVVRCLSEEVCLYVLVVSCISNRAIFVHHFVLILFPCIVLQHHRPLISRRTTVITQRKHTLSVGYIYMHVNNKQHKIHMRTTRTRTHTHTHSTSISLSLSHTHTHTHIHTHTHSFITRLTSHCTAKP